MSSVRKFYSTSVTTYFQKKHMELFWVCRQASLVFYEYSPYWQDQYDLTQDSLPQSVRKLLGVLENIEKVVTSSNAKEGATKENSKKATRKRNKGKRKGTGSHEVRVPKKVRVEKSCTLCQKHGGAHTTHNTGECRKYEKDGTLKKSFSGKAAVGQKRNGKGKTEGANSFTQIMDHISKLKKTVKEAQKGSRKKKRRYESSNTSDSDSE